MQFETLAVGRTGDPGKMVRSGRKRGPFLGSKNCCSCREVGLFSVRPCCGIGALDDPAIVGSQWDKASPKTDSVPSALLVTTHLLVHTTLSSQLSHGNEHLLWYIHI